MRVNVAVTAFAAVMVTVQVVAVEEPAPDQPVNVDVESGAAASVTLDAASKGAEPAEPQLMIPDVEVTTPPPVPVLVTVRAY